MEAIPWELMTEESDVFHRLISVVSYPVIRMLRAEPSSGLIKRLWQSFP